MNQDTAVGVTHANKAQRYLSGLKSFLKFLYDPENNEVMGRDGISWAKISLFYFAFYLVLGSLFVGMFAVFVATLDNREPTYFGGKSVMDIARDDFASKARVNPGLGFRPQIDPESSLIAYSISKPNNPDAIYKSDLNRLMNTLGNFLHYKYNSTPDLAIDCLDKTPEFISEKIIQGFHCSYDYMKVLEKTNCSPLIDFGYDSGPCVAIKLNRIFKWTPVSYSRDQLPAAVNLTNLNDSVLANNVLIRCDGENSADRDAIRSAKLTYYSTNSAQLNIYNVGLLPSYYFPYLNQDGYESPLVFVHFRDLPRFRLVNIICKAYAANIDSNDKINLRGMTQLQLYVEK